MAVVTTGSSTGIASNTGPTAAMIVATGAARCVNGTMTGATYAATAIAIMSAKTAIAAAGAIAAGTAAGAIAAETTAGVTVAGIIAGAIVAETTVGATAADTIAGATGARIASTTGIATAGKQTGAREFLLPGCRYRARAKACALFLCGCAERE